MHFDLLIGHSQEEKREYIIVFDKESRENEGCSAIQFEKKKRFSTFKHSVKYTEQPIL
jgi:3,4-dihydroxy-2-butanone 4-phosphate synthase